MTLKKLGVTKGSKIMVVGSTLNDVLEVRFFVSLYINEDLKF